MPLSSPKAQLFVEIKQVLRNHPDWDDDQVAEAAGVKQFDRDLISTARRDLEAG